MPHSTLARIVKVVNLAIAAALVVALAVVYWYAWRPLPQRSGSIEAPVSAPVVVRFDGYGVPHIQAASLEDALFAQGYVTAQDRLWQMDALRRLAAGDLSEVIGPATLESDRESRRLRLRRIAEDAYVDLPAPDRAAMAAYARGVNEFIDSHLGNLPVEFRLLGYQPRPWSVVDSLLICLHMFRTLTTTWQDDLRKGDLLAHGDAQKVDFLFPTRGSEEPPPGSNAWAIAGTRTASGKPLLANDMHLEYSLPGLWYMTHLEAPGLDVSGVALPGVPGIIVGHNQRIAWGITNLQFDVQDLYIEKVDQRTGRYLYRGQMEQARLEREIIRVKGRQTEEMPIWVTRHGPLFINDNGTQMALRWIAAEPGFFQYPFLDIDRAQTGRSSPPRWSACRGRLPTSSTPIPVATSATTPPANCPCGTAMRATCRWTAPPAISNGTASSRSTNSPPPSTRPAASSPPPTRTRFRPTIHTRSTATSRRLTAQARCGRASGPTGAGGLKICSACRATCTRHSANFWPGSWWPLTTGAIRASPILRMSSPCCAPGTGRWTFAGALRSSSLWRSRTCAPR